MAYGIWLLADLQKKKKTKHNLIEKKMMILLWMSSLIVTYRQAKVFSQKEKKEK